MIPTIHPARARSAGPSPQWQPRPAGSRSPSTAPIAIFLLPLGLERRSPWLMVRRRDGCRGRAAGSVISCGSRCVSAPPRARPGARAGEVHERPARPQPGFKEAQREAGMGVAMAVPTATEPGRSHQRLHRILELELKAEATAARGFTWWRAA
jgi:hypothetical protein